MKLYKLNNAFTALSSLSKKELPIRTAYKFCKIISLIDEEMKSLEEFRVKLVKKYGIEREDGNIEVPKNNLDDFNKEFNELLNSDIKIETIKFPLSMFEENDIKMSTMDINILDIAGFIEED